jgi:hypothetical protein
MNQVQDYFRKKFTKTGIALTVSQLTQYVKDNKISGVTRKQIGAFVNDELNVAKFSNVQRPKHYQSMGILRPGIYFIDHGEFEKHLSGHNKGNTGFLVSVENLTNKLFVTPCKQKGTPSWLEAIQKFIEVTRNVRTIYSDRDSVATSPKFKSRMVSYYGLRWYFLKKGSKSYLAERYIRFVKTKLSQAMLHKKTKNWIQFIQPLVTEYNKQKVEGTTFRRQAIDKSNFSTFLSQLFRTDEPELLFNTSHAGPFLQEKWNKQIFRFQIGQTVLLARRANWKKVEGDSDKPAGAFMKASTVGGFSDKHFTISGRQLRKQKGLKDFVAVYSLAEMGPSLHFYEQELKSVSASVSEEQT